MAHEFILECWDGTVWEFNNPACPISLRKTPTGLEGAPYTFDDQQNVNQAGVTFKARNDEANVIGLAVKVGPVAKGDEAEELLRTWRHSLGRGVELGTFHAIGTSGGDRFQVVRLAEKLPPPNYYKMRHAGVLTDEDGELVSLRSDESWWRKDPVVAEFLPAGFATATVSNAGDVAAWPHVVITGPITTPTLSFNGETPVPLPTIVAGDVWTIDTDPDWFTIVDSDGVDRSWVNRRWYKNIPPAATLVDPNVPITITGTGTTSATKVTVTLPQLFWEGI